MTRSRIGILGGTFNPIHFGHLRAAEDVREALGLDRILFVPSANPPHKKSDLVPAEKRLEMVRLALKHIAAFEASAVEIDRGDVSYSVRTLATLANTIPDAHLFFLLGLDAFSELSTWHEPETILKQADLVIMTRPGQDVEELNRSPFLEPMTPDEAEATRDKTRLAVGLRSRGGRPAHLVRVTALAISSTQLREDVRRGRSIRFLLPQEVESYILFNNLYHD